MQKPVTETQRVSPGAEGSRPESSQVKDLVCTDRELGIEWSDGHRSRYNRFWLRDNCPSAGDKTTAIRHFFLRQMGHNTRLRRAYVEQGHVCIEWDHEDHVSRFNADWLRAHCYEDASREARLHRPVLWGSDLQDTLPTVDFRSIVAGNEEHLRLLSHIVDYGFARLTHLPIEHDGIEHLEPLLAPFTLNDFGRVFDLVSEPDVWDLSQSSEALDPHTDDPYRYAPPGVRILYCLESSGDAGGASIIVNGIAAGEALRRLDPQAFERLASVPISYVRYREDPVPQGSDVHLRAQAPVLALNQHQQVVGVRFHERSMDTFELPVEDVEPYYEALIRFSTLINDGDFAIRHLLSPGEAFVFDNQQVLHGRTAFTGSPGRRHLRLCQMDRDLVHSRYRLLRSKHQRSGVHHSLFSGV